MSDSEKLDLVLEMLADIYAVTQKIAGKVGMEILPSPKVKSLLLQGD